jgi:predicted PhzF superfamily epimerase YddE/YHI9
MRVPLFQVDAFTTHRFAGNPAAVMVLDEFPDDAVLHALAAENNLAETAFLVADGFDYQLRWFTPVVEVPLCGHGTLASAAVVMERLQCERREVTFHTASGPLIVRRMDASYVMDLPVRVTASVSPPPALSEALGVSPLEVLVDAGNYTAVLADVRTVRELTPDFAAIGRRALRVDAVLGEAAGQDRASCISGFASWRRDPLPVGGRTHRAGRQLCVLSGRCSEDLSHWRIPMAVSPGCVIPSGQGKDAA